LKKLCAVVLFAFVAVFAAGAAFAAMPLPLEVVNGRIAPVFILPNNVAQETPQLVSADWTPGLNASNDLKASWDFYTRFQLPEREALNHFNTNNALFANTADDVYPVDGVEGTNITANLVSRDWVEEGTAREIARLLLRGRADLGRAYDGWGSHRRPGNALGVLGTGRNALAFGAPFGANARVRTTGAPENQSNLVPLRVWSADVSYLPGGTEGFVAVMHRIQKEVMTAPAPINVGDMVVAAADGVRENTPFGGKRAKDVFVAKVRAGAVTQTPRGELFTQVFSIDELNAAHANAAVLGTSAVVFRRNAAPNVQRILGREEFIDPDAPGEYYVMTTIRRGGDFNRSRATSTDRVTDPAFIVTTNPFAPTHATFHNMRGGLAPAQFVELSNRRAIVGETYTETYDVVENFQQRVFVRNDVIQAANYDLANVQRLALGVMTANGVAGDIAQFAYMLDSERFDGVRAGDLRLIAARGAGNLTEFTPVWAGEELTGGRSAIFRLRPDVENRFNLVGEDEELVSSDVYWIGAAIEDNSAFDFEHNRRAHIITPMFVAGARDVPVTPQLVLTASGSTTMEPGDTVNLVVTVSDGSAVPVVTWDSSDAAIASFVVSGDTCVVTAEAVGTANITCVPEVGSGINPATPVVITVAQNTPSGGSSGGCSVGGFAPATLLLLAPLFLLLKK